MLGCLAKGGALDLVVEATDRSHPPFGPYPPIPSLSSTLTLSQSTYQSLALAKLSVAHPFSA